jgi:hypothetical protein
MIEYTVKVFEDYTEWYLDGKLHREDGPAIEWKNGTKEWYRNGRQHREDGPAFESASGKYKGWWINGQRHREDGPAIKCTDGYKEWRINGIEYTEQEFLAKTKKPCSGKIVEIDGIKYKLIPE